MEPSAPSTTGDSADARLLNSLLVDALVKSGHIKSPRIEQAFRSVYRHHFLPNHSLEAVYKDEAIMTRVEGNVPLSSSSQPAMMAIMLEQLDLVPGEEVLEIGTATGYNAALMGHIVGETGRVISIDIDEELVEEAKENLKRAGVRNVTALAADGGYGYPEGAPYDAIILTVGSWDIAPAWIDQLAMDGQLLLPLALFSDYQESILFYRDGYRDDDFHHLTSHSHYCCSFVRLRGAFAGPEARTVEIEPNVKLYLEHDDARPFEPEQVRALLDAQTVDIPTGVSVNLRTIYHRLLRALSARLGALCGISAEGPAADSGIVPPLFHTPGKQSYSVGLIDEESLALLVGLPSASTSGKPSEDPFPLVVRCYGTGDHQGRQLVQEIIRWDNAGRPCEDPAMTIRAYPKSHPLSPSKNERLIQKEHTNLILSWPS